MEIPMKIKMFLVFGLSVFFIVSALSLSIDLFIKGEVKSGLDSEITNTIDAARESMGAIESIAIKSYLRAITEKDKGVISLLLQPVRKRRNFKRTTETKSVRIDPEPKNRYYGIYGWRHQQGNFIHSSESRRGGYQQNALLAQSRCAGSL